MKQQKASFDCTRMIRNVILWMLVFTASATFQISWVQSEDQNDPISLFNECLHIASMLTHQHLAERKPSEFEIEEIKKRGDEITRKLLIQADVAGQALASEYEESRGRGGTTRAVQLLGFAMRTGIAKSEFLGFAREAILETDLDEPRDPLLTTALEYLGEHGTESDLELMARLDGHVNQTYAQIRDRFAARLKERLSNGNAAGPETADSLGQQAGPTKGNEDEALAESGYKESSGLPVWGLLVIVVAVLGILVLLIRAFSRRRAS